MTHCLPLIPDPPQAKVAGMPVETRALSHPEVRLRIFNTEDPRILVPRLMGAGWTLNLGALATRLGLLRPEDSVADLAPFTPQPIRLALRALPWALAGITATVAATGTRTATRFPTNWDAHFRPTTTAPAIVALGIPTSLSLGAAVWSAWGDNGAFDPLRHTLASGTAAMALGVCSASVTSARHPHTPLPAVVPALLAGPLLAGAATVIALRAARANLQRSLDHPEQ